jgi:hypothetical protein
MALQVVELALAGETPDVATALEAARLGLAARPREPRPWELPPRRDCLWCGRDYQPLREHGRYCCDSCGAQARKARNGTTYRPAPTPDPRPCAHCGETFTPERRRDAKYCKPACSTAAWKKRARQRARARKAAVA